jgi:amino acid transporter
MMQHLVGRVSATQIKDEHSHPGKSLGAFLCWAVVFADIGTSVYYVPGILYGQIGKLAGFFVFLTMSAFVLLTLKYVEVSHRFPEGGGVVTVAARSLNRWAGALGGMFILVDYFLTAAISSLSGIQYFTDVLPGIRAYILPITLIALVLLGLLNWWGVRESATVSATVALIAFGSDIAILYQVFTHVPLGHLLAVAGAIFQTRRLAPTALLVGFAGSFLAFSGLESISQLSPVMKIPRKRTAGFAMALVVLTIGLTSPLLTLFSTTLLAANAVDPNKFISELGGAFGGPGLELAVAISASALLVFASNTAIIGSYHVFLALSRMQFFPKVIERRNHWRQTPHVSIFLATAIPIVVLVGAAGNIDLLGDMYAFGLLGAFSLTCLGLDILRWRERRVAAAAAMGEHRPYPQTVRTGRVRRFFWPLNYGLGVLTTIVVMVAWSTNLVAKPLATAFGGSVTLIGITIAVIHYNILSRSGQHIVFPSALEEPLPGSVLVILPARSGNDEALIRAACEGAQGRTIVFLYLSERVPTYEPQLFEVAQPYFEDIAAQTAFKKAETIARRIGVNARFVYRASMPGMVAQVWEQIHPSDIVAEAGNTQNCLSREVYPDHIRYNPRTGVRVAHYIKHG